MFYLGMVKKLRRCKMAGYCEDCGCRVYNGRCTNCHEELYIEDQYYELDMPLPSKESEFMKKVNRCQEDVNRKSLLKKEEVKC